MERSTLDLWVGLFVVAGIGALMVLAMKVGNMSGVSAGDSYMLTANFENIGGLKPRAPIKSAGVVVGRVAGITFDNEKFVAKVTMDTAHPARCQRGLAPAMARATVPPPRSAISHAPKATSIECIQRAEFIAVIAGKSPGVPSG